MVQSGLDATKRGVHDINVTIQARQSLIVSLCELDHLLHRVILFCGRNISVLALSMLLFARLAGLATITFLFAFPTFLARRSGSLYASGWLVFVPLDGSGRSLRACMPSHTRRSAGQMERSRCAALRPVTLANVNHVRPCTHVAGGTEAEARLSCHRVVDVSRCIILCDSVVPIRWSNKVWLLERTHLS